METYTSNLKSVALTAFELLAFNGQKFRGHVTLATLLFEKIFKRSCSDRPWKNTSNLKSVALTVLELLAFNAKKFKGSRDPGHAPFSKNFRGSCPDWSWKHTRQILSP